MANKSNVWHRILVSKLTFTYHIFLGVYCSVVYQNRLKKLKKKKQLLSINTRGIYNYYCNVITK